MRVEGRLTNSGVLPFITLALVTKLLNFIHTFFRLSSYLGDRQMEFNCEKTEDHADLVKKIEMLLIRFFVVCHLIQSTF